MTKKRWTAKDKTKKSLATSADTADMCKKYGFSPDTFYPWRDKFPDRGKAALAGSSGTRVTKAIQKENADLKILIYKITLANDLLKKI